MNQQQYNPPTNFDFSEPFEDIESSTDGSQWVEPQEIDSVAELLPIPTMSQEMLPEPFRKWLVDIAYRMQCPIEYVAAASIVVVSSIIGTGCAIRPKIKDSGWTVVPNLWGAVVGRPSTLKSPALQQVMEPLDRMERQSREQFNQKTREYEIESELFALRRDSIKKSARSAKSDAEQQSVSRALMELAEPAKPSRRRLRTNNATVPKLTELLRENPRGILVFADELVGLIASWDQAGNESTRAYFLTAWNGTGSHTDDRIGRGTIDADVVCLSVLGGIQPDRLQMYLHQTVQQLGNDGLLQRFQLLVYPNESEPRIVDEFPDKVAKARAHGIIEKLRDFDFHSIGAISDNEESTPYLNFSSEAQDTFYRWWQIHQERLKAEPIPFMQEHLAKYPSLMASLALIFHLIDVVDDKAKGNVSRHCAEMAAAWCALLEKHARRAYGLVADMQTKANCALAAKLTRGSLLDGFCERDVVRKNWRHLTEQKAIKGALEELVLSGWLKEESITPEFQQRGKTVFRINPRIYISQNSVNNVSTESKEVERSKDCP